MWQEGEETEMRHRKLESGGALSSDGRKGTASHYSDVYLYTNTKIMSHGTPLPSNLLHDCLVAWCFLGWSSFFTWLDPGTLCSWHGHAPALHV